jgi:sugar lactone lactonase YvrE
MIRDLWRTIWLLIVVCVARDGVAATISPGDILVTLDSGTGSVVAINPVTGNRTVVSDPSHGSGPQLPIQQITVDSHGVIYAATGMLFPTSPGAILRIDPITGNRTIISDSTHGTGPLLLSGTADASSGIAVGPDGSIYTADRQLGNLFRIDPLTGNRTLISTGVQAIQYPITNSAGLRLGTHNDLLVATSNVLGLVVDIDLATGTRTNISGGAHGSGPILNSLPGGITWDGLGNLVMGSGPGLPQILRIDVASGNRTVLASTGFSSVADVLLAPNGKILATDYFGSVVFSVDPVTGNRTTLSGLGVGSGPFLNRPLAMAIYVPEPASIVLAACGLVALLLSKRKSRCRCLAD